MSSVLPRLCRASAAAFLLTGITFAACSDSPKKAVADHAPIDPRDAAASNLYPAFRGTIGEYAIFADAGPLAVEGYGVVAELPGTGSGDMPPAVREILLDQLFKAGAGSYTRGTENIVPEKILTSKEIAAVEVRGVIPSLARKGDSFDLVVNCLPNSQATSLSDGLLWTCDLKVIGLTADTRNDTARIALGRGPVFLPGPVKALAGDPAATQPTASRRALRAGTIIAGGRCAEDRLVRFQTFIPSWRTTGAIERAINSRFTGRDKCASANSDTIIALKIPPEYQSNPGDFLNLVKHMYLFQETPGFSEHKAAELIKCLSDPAAPRFDISVALQALGRSILPDYIQPQYTNPDPVVRFWCARAGAGLQDVGGMVVLQEFAKDPGSPFRKEAVAAIVDFSRGGDTVRATLTLAEVLKSKDPLERIAAYEGLVAIKSPAVTSYGVGRKFILDVVPSDGPSLIYVTESETARIALIGRPLYLSPGVLYVSPDNALTVNVLDSDAAATGSTITASAVNQAPLVTTQTSPAKKENVTLYWRSPRGDRTVEVKTSSRLTDVIARLGWIPDPKSPNFDPKASYVGASYQRITEMLASLCKDQLLDAQFVLQKAPEPLIRTPSDILNDERPEGSTEEPVPTPSTNHAPATQPKP